MTTPLLESIKKSIARFKQSRQPIVIKEQDLEEQFIRGSGPGGQNVNMRDTCVRLLHVPTNISVRSQFSRHQELNRQEARKLLRQALDDHVNKQCSLSNLKKMEKKEKARKKKAKARKKYSQMESSPLITTRQS